MNMEFIPWKTSFAIHKDLHKEARKYTLEEHYKHLVDLAETTLTKLNKHPFFTNPVGNRVLDSGKLESLDLEYEWLKTGSPYYNVYENAFSVLKDINLSKVRFRDLELPHGHSVVNFRFPWECTKISFEKILDESYHLDTKRKPFKTALLKISKEEDSVTLMVIYDLAAHVQGHPECTVNQSFTKKFPLDDFVGEKLKDTDFLRDLDLSKGDNILFVQALVTMIAVGFLSNSDSENLLRPDVLKEDDSKLQKAISERDEKEIQRLVNRARNKRKNGYNVNTCEVLLDYEFNQERSHSHSFEPKRALSYSHFRGGHPHIVRYGKGKEKLKIKWFRPIQVRPDLPFKKETT